MSRMVAVLLRFDTEDFLTAESDDAALYLAQTLRRRGLRATFPMTAWKVQALLSRGRRDVLAAIAEHAVGFHSTSHSLHPTIAEELARTPDADAEERFRLREEAGWSAVAEAFAGRLSAYTQPGGNWVAEAAAALRAWGIPLHYSESWNSYIDVRGRPFFLGGVLTWSSEVAAPKPFLSGLPGCLGEAQAQLGAAIRRERLDGVGDAGLVSVVAHPTELVTEAFWDQVNFAAGRNRPRRSWAPPPRRPAPAVRLAEAAFERWLDALGQSGAEVWTAEDLAAAFPDPAAGAAFRIADARAIAAAWERGAIGSVAVRGIPLSAAEALMVLAQAAGAVDRGEWRAPAAASAALPPWGAADADPVPRGARAEGEALLRAAAALATGGRFPARVPVADVELPLADLAATLAGALAARLAEGRWPASCPVTAGTLLAARHVKPAAELHWDWPIFAPGFRPERLRRRALDAAWTLKPAEPELCDHRVGAPR